MTSYQLWSTLIQYGVSPNQVYFLDCCRNKIKPAKIINEDAEAMVCKAKGLLTPDNKFTPLAVQLLNDFETFLVKTKKKVTIEVLGEDFINKVNEYRELFPKGKFPSGKLARQNIQELKDKFVWFFKTYPEYNWDLILDATDYYLFLEEKKGYSYTVCSSYFIKKTDTISKEIKSPLADFCQLIMEDPSILSSI